MSKQIFKLLLSFLLLMSINHLNAQISIKIVQFRPTNDFGFIAEKTFGPELIWKKEFNGSTRTRYYVNFANYKSRMDTIPTVSYVSSGNGSEILPSYYGYSKIWNLSLGFGFDYSPEILEDWLIRPFIGMDLNTGAHQRQTFTNTGVSSIDEGNLVPLFGAVGRFGLESTFDKFGVFLEATRNYNLYIPIASGSLNTIGFGVTYLLD